MKYEFNKKYGKLGEIKSKELISQLNIISMQIGKEYTAIVRERAIRIKCIGIYGDTIKIKILEIK